MTDKIISEKQPSRRRPEADRDKLFQLIADLFYYPEASLDELGAQLNLSISTIKRQMSYLRKNKVLEGRLGSLRLNLTSLMKLPESYSTAFVAIESHADKLKKPQRTKTSLPYESEEELLQWICKDLARSDSYKGKILVEDGHIVMGSEAFGMLITIHAISNNVLFDFVRLGIERAEGVVRSQTLMVAYTVE